MHTVEDWNQLNLGLMAFLPPFWDDFTRFTKSERLVYSVSEDRETYQGHFMRLDMLIYKLDEKKF